MQVLVDDNNGLTDSAKRKHIVWNEDNLSYNEANKSVGGTAERSPVHPLLLFIYLFFFTLSRN